MTFLALAAIGFEPRPYRLYTVRQIGTAAVSAALFGPWDGMPVVLQ